MINNEKDVRDELYDLTPENQKDEMYEPIEEEFMDTGEKILKLSDRLAEEIILENIGEQLSAELDTLNTRINYISLFREKFDSIQPDDDCYDDGYMKASLARVATLVGVGIKNKYGVELGEDLDFTPPAIYLYDMETLYEFLFIRHYQNLVDYIEYRLSKERNNFIEAYTDLMDDEKNSKDLFVIQSKKKFKNEDDVLIMHFMNEIIHDIIDSTTSAYTLFSTIVNLDLYEEYNHRMYELIENYGNKLVLNNDEDSAKLYMKPLEDQATFSEIKNAVLMHYLETCELDD